MNAIARRGGAAQRTVLLLISLLVAVTAAALFAVPGYLDVHRASALRGALAASQSQLRIGVTETAQVNPNAPGSATTAVLSTDDAWGGKALPASIRGVLGAPTVVAASAGSGRQSEGSQTKVPTAALDSTPPGFGLRAPYGSAGKLRTVAGEAPPAPDDDAKDAGPGLPSPTDRVPSVWGWISQAAATKIHVNVGDRFTLTSDRWTEPVKVTVAGIFAPVDPKDPWWTDPATNAATSLAEPFVDTYYNPVDEEERTYWHGDFLLDDSGAQRVGWATGMAVTWSFPLKPDALTPGNAARVVADLNRSRTGTDLPAFPQVNDPETGQQVDTLKSVGLTTPLPPVLSGYLTRAGTSMIVMSLGLAVLLAVALGVVALAVRLLIQRQRPDLVVARARGASLPELARSVGYQVAAATVGAVAVALAAAWGAGYAHLDVGLVLVAAAVVAAAFLMAAGQSAASLRGTISATGTGRLGGKTDSVVRVGLELIVLAVLTAQIMTLHSRGLGAAEGGIDPVVATLPVTVSLAAGVVLLRLAPFVPRVLAAMLGSGRGATGFVATASARRSAVIGPLASVVILATLSGAVFGATFTRSLSVAREANQWASVGGGVHVNDPMVGFGSSQITNADLAKMRSVPGVTAVAGGATDGAATLAVGSTDPTAGMPVIFIGLDVDAYLTVIKGTPLDTPGLHRALTALSAASKARPLGDYSPTNPDHPPLPALLTFGAAPGNAGTVQGTVQYAGLPVSIITNAPALPAGMAPKGEATLVVDYQVLKAELRVEPSRSDAWAAGTPAALTALSKEGFLSDPNDQTTVQAGLADISGTSSLDRLTERLYAAETVLEGLLCALAVLLTLAAGSGARRRAAAFLATMGFGRRRLRRIAVLEALPVLAVVTAGGVATGLAMVPLLAGSVDLSALAGLDAARLAVHADVLVVVAAAAGVPGMALLAVFVEAAVRKPLTVVGALRGDR